MVSVDRTAIPAMALAAAGIVTILFGIARYLPTGSSDFGMLGEIELAVFVVAGLVLLGLSRYSWKIGRPDVSLAVFVAWLVVAILEPIGLFGVVENTQLAAVIGVGIAGSFAAFSWYLSGVGSENQLIPSGNG